MASLALQATGQGGDGLRKDQKTDWTFTFSFMASTWKGKSERQLEEEKDKRRVSDRGTDAGNDATSDTNADLRSLQERKYASFTKSLKRGG